MSSRTKSANKHLKPVKSFPFLDHWPRFTQSPAFQLDSPERDQQNLLLISELAGPFHRQLYDSLLRVYNPQERYLCIKINDLNHDCTGELTCKFSLRAPDVSSLQLYLFNSRNWFAGQLSTKSTVERNLNHLALMTFQFGQNCNFLLLTYMYLLENYERFQLDEIKHILDDAPKVYPYLTGWLDQIFQQQTDNLAQLQLCPADAQQYVRYCFAVHFHYRFVVLAMTQYAWYLLSQLYCLPRQLDRLQLEREVFNMHRSINQHTISPRFQPYHEHCLSVTDRVHDYLTTLKPTSSS